MTRKAEQYLRYAVEKWLGFRPPRSARVAAYGRSASGGGRYVCVETEKNDERLALFFFQHEDGCWRVVPPAQTMPAMTIERLAA